MSTEDSPRTARPAILERLGIAEDPLIGADPVSFLRALLAAALVAKLLQVDDRE